MKAGIFKLRDKTGTLLYVAKDRSIRAHTNTPDGVGEATVESTRKEFRVTARAKDTIIELEDGTLGDRVADVPIGCTDPVKALNDTKHALAARAILESPAEVAAGLRWDQPGALPLVDMENWAANKALEDFAEPARTCWGAFAADYPRNTLLKVFRRCHKQSARKHRKKGHTVFRGDDGAYWWHHGDQPATVINKHERLR